MNQPETTADGSVGKPPPAPSPGARDQMASLLFYSSGSEDDARPIEISDSESDTGPSSSSDNSNASAKAEKVPLTMTEKQRLAESLYRELCGHIEAKNYRAVFSLVSNQLSTTLLHLLPVETQQECCLWFLLSYYATYRIHTTIHFLMQMPGWSVSSVFLNLFDAAILSTVSQRIFTFVLDLASLGGQPVDSVSTGGNAADAVRLLGDFLLLEQATIRGYNSALAKKERKPIDRQAARRGVFPSFRYASGSNYQNDHPLLELMHPRLVSKMLYFMMVAYGEKLKQPKKAVDCLSSLRSYCAYFNYSFPQLLTLAEYRLFNGQTFYPTYRAYQSQANTLLWNLNQTDKLSDAFIDSVLQAISTFKNNKINENAEVNLAKCNQTLKETLEKKTSDRESGGPSASDEEKLNEARYLRLYRDILLNRALIACDRPQDDAGSSSSPNAGGRAFDLLQQAMTVTSDLGAPDSLALEPISASLLLHFANNALALGKTEEALDILRHLFMYDASPGVYHRLGDAYLRRYLEQAKDNERIEGELAQLKTGAKPETIKEASPIRLIQAWSAYTRVKELVGELLENRAYEAEEGDTKESMASTSNGKKAKKKKKKKKSKKEQDGAKESAPMAPVVKPPETEAPLVSTAKRTFHQDYYAIHRTFLEEMYIQARLNIAYCFLYRRLYQEALDELMPLLEARLPSFVSPEAVSKDAYALASLYAGEANFELGLGQPAAQLFDYAAMLAKYETSYWDAKQVSVWRGYLRGQDQGPTGGLPACPDVPIEKSDIVLDGVFSYNYLTTLASMGRSERLPGRLARLRPNAIVSKGCLSLFSGYVSVIPTRLTQLRESLDCGRLARLEDLTLQAWNSTLITIKRLGNIVPEWVKGSGQTKTTKTKKKGQLKPLTAEQADRLLMAVYCGSGAVNVTIPADPLNPPSPEDEVRNELAKQAQEYDPSAMASLTLEEKTVLGQSLARKAAELYADGSFEECYEVLESGMSEELLRLQSYAQQTNLAMIHNLSYYAVIDRLDATLFACFKNTIVSSHWNIRDPLDAGTLSTVSEHFFAFALKLLRLEGQDVEIQNAHLGDVSQTIEAFLFVDPHQVVYFTHLSSKLRGNLRIHPRTGNWFLPDVTWDPTDPNSTGPTYSAPVIEFLDPAITVRLLVFLLINLREKLAKPDDAMKLFSNLCVFLRYAKYPLPQLQALLEYRLFTGQICYKVADELAVQKEAFLERINCETSKMTAEFIGTAGKAFALYCDKADYAGADKLLLECDRQLLARKKELAKFQAMVVREKDEGLRSSLAERLLDSKAKYLAVLRDIRLNRALLALDCQENEQATQLAFELFQEALTIGASSELYSPRLEPINRRLLLHFANSALALGDYSAAILILKYALRYSASSVLFHRLGDAHLARYCASIDSSAITLQIDSLVNEKAGKPQQASPESPSVLSETAKKDLEQALENYDFARQNVTYFLENNLLEEEEARTRKKFLDRFPEFKKSNDEPSSLDNQRNVPSGSARGIFEPKPKKGKGKNAKKAKNPKSTKKFDSDGKPDPDGPEEARQPVGPTLGSAYSSIHRTFLEEMYCQLSLNMIYCYLACRRYTEAMKECRYLLFSVFPENASREFALSPTNDSLLQLYHGEVYFEAGNGFAALLHFNYSKLGKLLDSFGEDPEALWRSYLTPATLPTVGLPACPDKPLVEGENTLEFLFNYNYLTTLANINQLERHPLGLARLRPNPIAAKGSLAHFAAYSQMCSFRVGQIQDSLREGRLGRLGSLEERAQFKETLKRIKSQKSYLPAIEELHSLTVNERNLLSVAVYQGDDFVKGEIPEDKEYPRVLGKDEAPDKVEAEVDEEKSEMQASPETSNQTASGESQVEEKEEEILAIDSQVELENRFTTLHGQVSSDKVEAILEPNVKEEITQSKDEEVLVQEEKCSNGDEVDASKDGESLMESTSSSSPPTIEVNENSSFEFVEEAKEESTAEEAKGQPEDSLCVSKWSHVDEQLEMGADNDEEDALSTFADSTTEASANWESVLKDCAHEEWDLPQEGLENDTFFGLPQETGPTAETKDLSAPLDNQLAAFAESSHHPAIKVSSTSVSQNAQAAVNEIGNLLNKCKLSGAETLNPVPQVAVNEPEQPQAVPLPPAPTPAAPSFPGAINLADLSVHNKKSLLSRYLSEQADCASTRAPTPPPGGHFNYGPIGRPPMQAESFEEDEDEEEDEEDDEDDPSDAYMKLSHHYALLAHHEKEKKAQEKKVKELLAQIGGGGVQKKEKRSNPKKGPAQQQHQFTDWRQVTPALGQEGLASLSASTSSSPFSAFGLGSSTSMLGPDPFSEAQTAFQPPTTSSSYQTLNSGSPFGTASPCNVPPPSNGAFGNSFGLSIDLATDYFASSQPSVNRNLSNSSVPFGGRQGAPGPAHAPPGLVQPPGQIGQAEGATLAELFNSISTKKQ